MEGFDLDPRLAKWISVVDYYWERRGFSPSERERLRSALQRALGASLSEGASVEELIAVDPSYLARHAVPSEVLRRQRRTRRPQLSWASVLTVLTGAAIGGLLVLAMWYPLMARIRMPLSYDQQAIFALGIHAGAACIVAACTIGAVRWRRRVPPLAAFVGLLVLFAAAFGVSPAVLLSASGSYSIQAPTLFSQAAIILASCATSLLLVRWVLTRAGVR